jgi:hypothetical protein
MGKEAGSLRDQLQEAIEDCIVLNERLERILPTPLHHLPGEIRHGKVSAAPVPWYTQAAWLIMDLHAESREMESRLRLYAAQPVRVRGGSSDNTYKALEAVMAISWAVEDNCVQECRRWIDRWCGRARIALGETDEPRRLPRQPGQKDPACPYCTERTLRFWALSGMVRCVNPACRLDDGQKPSARMEYSNIASDFILVWSDNSVGVPV